MLRLLKITGESLSPDFNEGDFVLVSKIPFWFLRPADGDVVVLNHPVYGMLIKRVEHVTPDGAQVFVIGDHEHSLDSRHFGPVPRKELLGKVIWHIRQ